MKLKTFCVSYINITQVKRQTTKWKKNSSLVINLTKGHWGKWYTPTLLVGMRTCITTLVIQYGGLEKLEINLL